MHCGHPHKISGPYTRATSHAWRPLKLNERENYCICRFGKSSAREECSSCKKYRTQLVLTFDCTPVSTPVSRRMFHFKIGAESWCPADRNDQRRKRDVALQLNLYLRAAIDAGRCVIDLSILGRINHRACAPRQSILRDQPKPPNVNFSMIPTSLI